MSGSQHSIWEDMKKYFGEINAALESQLKKYRFVKTYPYFLAAAFLASLSLGVAASFAQISTTVTNFGADIIIFTVLISFVVFPVFTYLLIHIYKGFFKTVAATNRALSFQIVALFFSIALSFVLNSVNFIYGGFAIFLAMLFVYPLMKKLYVNETSKQDFNSTLNTVYILIIAIVNLVQLIQNFAKL